MKYKHTILLLIIIVLQGIIIYGVNKPQDEEKSWQPTSEFDIPADWWELVVDEIGLSGDMHVEKKGNDFYINRHYAFTPKVCKRLLKDFAPLTTGQKNWLKKQSQRGTK